MIRGIVILFCLLGALCAAAEDKDPVKEKLFAAKVAYDAEMGKYRKAAEDWFDRREEAARKDGNKKLVDQVKAERETFVVEGDLPKNVPLVISQKQAAAKKSLEAAYAQAVKDYVKAKKDAEAAVIEKELESLRKGEEAKRPEKILLGTWKVNVGTYKGEWTFKEGGVVDSSTDGPVAGKWEIDTAKKRMVVTWKNACQDKFDLPINPKGTTGSQVGRMNSKLEAVKIK